MVLGEGIVPYERGAPVSNSTLNSSCISHSGLQRNFLNESGSEKFIALMVGGRPALRPEKREIDNRFRVLGATSCRTAPCTSPGTARVESRGWRGWRRLDRHRQTPGEGRAPFNEGEEVTVEELPCMEVAGAVACGECNGERERGSKLRDLGNGERKTTGYDPLEMARKRQQATSPWTSRGMRCSASAVHGRERVGEP